MELWHTACSIKGVTKKELKTKLKALGMTVRIQDGEIRVNFKGGDEVTAYYTPDTLDAYNTAKAMEAHKNFAEIY